MFGRTNIRPVKNGLYANVPKRADGHAISGAGAEDTPAHVGQLVDVAAVHRAVWAVLLLNSPEH